MFFEPQGWFVGSEATVQTGNALFGLLLASLVGLVVVGGIRRIGSVAARLVPVMIILYTGTSSSFSCAMSERILPRLCGNFIGRVYRASGCGWGTGNGDCNRGSPGRFFK